MHTFPVLALTTKVCATKGASMKSENIEIDGVNYEIRELSAAAGWKYISVEPADIMGLLGACVTVNGVQASADTIGMSALAKLMPIVQKLNLGSEPASGNG